MTDPDIRDLLGLAAGSPEPGPLLLEVRRQVRTARRRRQVAVGVAAVVVTCAVVGGTASALHGSHRTGSVLTQSSALPTQVGRTDGPSLSPTATALTAATPTTTVPSVTAAAASDFSLRPSPGESFSVDNTTGTGPCTFDQLTAGRTTALHILAGEDGVDLALRAKTPCALTVAGLQISPDAAVPVTRMTGPKLQILPNGVIHLVLLGESDGFCGAIPTARHVSVSVGGTRLTTVQLPTLGLCTSITATLQRDAATSERPVVDGSPGH